MESIKGWLTSSKSARFTGLASAGSKPIILKWDVATGIITLDEVNEKEDVVSTIFTKKVSEIKRASFLPGRYSLMTSDGLYIITSRLQDKALGDIVSVVDQATGSVINNVSDASSGIDSLQALLGDKVTTHISASSRLKITVVVIVVVFVALIAGVVYSFVRGIS